MQPQKKKKKKIEEKVKLTYDYFSNDSGLPKGLEKEGEQSSDEEN